MKRILPKVTVGAVALLGALAVSPTSGRGEESCGPGGCVTYYRYEAAPGGYICWAQTCYPMTMSCCQTGGG